MKICLLILAAAIVVPAPVDAADKPPVPKMFQSMGKGKGQWRLEFLEGGPAYGGKAPPTMTICTDNLASHTDGREERPSPDCKYRVLKDTANEALIETKCKDRSATVDMKRENADSVLMEVASTGSRGPRSMKMRYTHLGPCRAGQGTLSYDKNSEQCRKIREQAARMDPEKSCARETANREQCVQRMRDHSAKLGAMCK